MSSTVLFPCRNALKHSVTRSISSLFAQSIQTTLKPYQDLHRHDDARGASIAPCRKDSMGDYQCNDAMSIAHMLSREAQQRHTTKNHDKGLDAAVSSKGIAQSIVDNLSHEGRNRMLQELSVSGPGFVRFRVNRQWLADVLHESFLQHLDDKEMQEISQQQQQRVEGKHKKRKVIVDFSSPNLAKEMHVGHLRSTIIGDVISRILEYYEDDETSFDVLRLNHLGDWGTQFGMLIAYMKRKELYQRVIDEWGENDDSRDMLLSLHDLQEFYREAKKLFDEDNVFKKEAHNEVVTLQNGADADCIKAWQYLCQCSRNENQEIYDKLKIRINDRGESFYAPYIPHVMSLLENMQVNHSKNGTPLLQESDGAKVLFIPGMTEGRPPLMLQKSDDGYTYDTTDVAAIWQRLKEEFADWLIYVTDSGQSLHFELLFEAAKYAGWADESKHRFDFVGFGVVTGEDGKKFKTRSGEVIKLTSLLEEAKSRARKVIKAKNEERVKENASLCPLTDEELDHAAEVVGYGAVKYADLKGNRTSNYLFSFDRMLDFRGNTAVYLLYAYARIQSIMDKAMQSYGFTEEELFQKGGIQLDHTSEVKLALVLCKFPTVLEKVVDTLEPHHLCDFLYETSTQFSSFHRDCRVLGNEDNRQLAISRYLVCKGTSIVMKQCFSLLGIDTLNRL